MSQALSFTYKPLLLYPTMAFKAFQQVYPVLWLWVLVHLKPDY
jgi:hypothetical protein